MQRWVLTIGALSLGLFGLTSTATAQNGEDDDPECDSRFEEEGECGTPNQSGGGAANSSVLVNRTDRGETYQFGDDYDNDGVEDNLDNCVRDSNPDQLEADGDSVGDICDNCVQTANEQQSDIDGTEKGDACDPDMDGDQVLDEADNCPNIPNPAIDGTQPDLDENGGGDACDSDIDGDGVPNADDPCPASAEITDPSNTSPGSKCFPDKDGDGIPDATDVCVRVYDPKQPDTDGDGRGSRCDPDRDGDSVQNVRDNCVQTPNAGQVDGDRDGDGTVCDEDFCYVVAGDESSCLDPEEPLDVYSPEKVGETGKWVELPLYANRRNQAMEYHWKLKGAPEGSQAVVENRKGTVSVSSPFEYQYTERDVPRFEPDKPGKYEFQLEVEPVFEDRVSGETDERATHTVPIRVEGESMRTQGGCGANVAAGDRPVSAALWMFLLGLVGLVSRRRR